MKDMAKIVPLDFLMLFQFANQLHVSQPGLFPDFAEERIFNWLARLDRSRRNLYARFGIVVVSEDEQLAAVIALAGDVGEDFVSHLWPGDVDLFEFHRVVVRPPQFV